MEALSVPWQIRRVAVRERPYRDCSPCRAERRVQRSRSARTPVAKVHWLSGPDVRRLRLRCPAAERVAPGIGWEDWSAAELYTTRHQRRLAPTSIHNPEQR